MNTTHGRSEERAGRRGRNPVLAGAGLGDHPVLAEPPGEQRLAQGVVDLVGPGVGEVLALEIQVQPARQPGRRVVGDGALERLVGEAVGAVEGRRTTGVRGQQLAEL